MKQIFILFTLILCCPSFFAQEKSTQNNDTVYISPNNNGIQDALVIPLKIRDKRYIEEWSLIITDENGTIVRTIANKEKRPDRMTFKVFFQQLFKKKTGVDIPPSITWNGLNDSSELVPDGIYYYHVTATDDNGNFSKTNPLRVVVDTIAPTLNLQKFPNAAASVFSPDGDSNKDTLQITQSGSIEHKWQAKITNVAGETIRSFEWNDQAPQSFSWDGRNNKEEIVPDGVYSYTISCSDLAGNFVTDRLLNIVVDTIKPVIAITIDTNAFSPNGNGVKDTLTLLPTISSTAGLVEWNISIIDAKNSVFRTYSSNDKKIDKIDFDGKNDLDENIPEGMYQADFKVLYQNGYNPQIKSPLFELNITPPKITLSTKEHIFSPDGDSIKDTITFQQTTNSVATWQGEIKDSQDNIVRTYDFGNTLPQSTVWDGFTDKKTLAEDGIYTYVVTGNDNAGNTGIATTKSFELNTGTTEVILTVNRPAFSPKAENNIISFIPIVKTKSEIVSYVITIRDSKNKIVYTAEENANLPEKFDWNGVDSTENIVSDGNYVATIETISDNGVKAKSSAPEFAVDTIIPSVTASVAYTIFSPNDDGKKDILPFIIETTKDSVWTGEISDGNKIVRHYEWNGKVSSFDWDGKDDIGNPVADGKYNFIIKTMDTVGNQAEAKIDSIILDTRTPKAYITLSQSLIVPSENSKNATQNIGLSVNITERIEQWHIFIKEFDTNKIVKTWNNETTANFPKELQWNSKNDDDTLVQGEFYVELQILYEKGDELLEKSTNFVSWMTPPELKVTTSPTYFSPDNDGIDDDLFITLQAESKIPFAKWTFEIFDPQNNSSFWQTGGKSTITEQLTWDGKSNKGELVQSATDYPYTFTVTDTMGMTSKTEGFIAVDVLVLRFGDILKIQIPSIVFTDSRDDFVGLANDVIEKNNFVLRRIAISLNKFKDYKVVIEGHANAVDRTAKEAAFNLTLSDRRAKAIRERLIKLGVDGNRLSTIGKGDAEPIVPYADRANWWKNRRVEFILIK
ncbi:MAG: FlgD immunoglobulin-like domain containing protein [Treponemataceae bacterium]